MSIAHAHMQSNMPKGASTRALPRSPQVSLTSALASRAARFTRVCLNRLRRVEALPGTRGVVVQDVSISLELGGGAASKDKAGKVTPEPKVRAMPGVVC